MPPGGDAHGFLDGSFVSLFILFNTFSVNMVLQYKQVGRWQDDIYDERAYIFLSLIAKTTLAWKIFANTLID